MKKFVLLCLTAVMTLSIISPLAANAAQTGSYYQYAMPADTRDYLFGPLPKRNSTPFYISLKGSGTGGAYYRPYASFSATELAGTFLGGEATLHLYPGESGRLQNSIASMGVSNAALGVRNGSPVPATITGEWQADS